MLKSVVYKTRMNKFPVLDIIKVASHISHPIALCVYQLHSVYIVTAMFFFQLHFESLLCL